MPTIQSNGALEQSHRTLAEYLRHFTNADQTDWDDWLPHAIFAYNTTTPSPLNTATGYTTTLPTALLSPPKLSYN